MKQQTKGGALHKVWQALPWLWMAAAYLFDLWYQLVPGKWIVDSDLASEMILSDLLNKEGTIISHNWFYSTELKVVNLQWFYRLGLLIFPNDWHLARTFGMAITLALFLLIYLFLIIGWARIVIHLIKVGPHIDEGDGAGKETVRKAGNNSNGNVGASIGKAGE